VGVSKTPESSKKHTLDTSGLSCPEPVMLLHGAVRDAAEGDSILVIATDPSTQRDIPKFCTYLGHELVSAVEEDGKFTFSILKGGS